MNLAVEEFASIGLIKINLNDSLDVALKIMSQNGIRHLLVMEENKLVGIVSDKDILANYEKEWSSTLRIKNIMKTDILYAHFADNLSQVAYRLAMTKNDAAVILDSNGELYGIFTTTDALNALVEAS